MAPGGRRWNRPQHLGSLRETLAGSGAISKAQAPHTHAPAGCSSQNIISRRSATLPREISPLTTPPPFSNHPLTILWPKRKLQHQSTRLVRGRPAPVVSDPERIPSRRQWPHPKYAALALGGPRFADILHPLQEMQQSSRPLTQNRSPMSTSSSGLPGRQPHARTSSHSLLTGALNANHRVTRRKSVTNPSSNVAAIAAVIRDSERAGAVPIVNGSRRNTMTKSAAARAAIVGSLPSPPASLPNHKSMPDPKRELNGSAIEDDPNDGSADEGTDKFQKARQRRASDGQTLKESKKSNRVEVRCDKCGKGYKHSSCLTKHLLVPLLPLSCYHISESFLKMDPVLGVWEHTPEWSYTSKLLISKHQQVQLLEAASVLVAMNGTGNDAATPPDSAKDFQSEAGSSSPAASRYSDPAERQSSVDTTPPPVAEGVNVNGTSYRNKRFSSSGGYARSFQSAPSAASFGAGSIPYSSGFGHRRQPSNDHRPSSSGRNATGEDDRDLAAAVELLSCSFGSNNGSRTATVPEDAPPVPPLPAQYLDQATPLSAAGFINSYPRRQPESFTRGEMRRPSEDVKMEESGDSVMDDDDFEMRSRGRSEDDDDGVFGRMEE
ncbi:hypothetical protein FZEAL_351 [Fusarium zealandicum]|uniref:C2H2-type domain-containing protein n=1 Tax=Fusarium zealandicum TaxID=1053134 RepID=A0A8H4UVJ6_9HYPO|nr:hypothetical protein FZEAL_351 [Fusarium zealandicum]